MLIAALISLEPWWLIWGDPGPWQRSHWRDTIKSERKRESAMAALFLPHPTFLMGSPTGQARSQPVGVSCQLYKGDQLKNGSANLGSSGLAWYTISINIQGSIYTPQLLEAGIKAEGDEINSSNIQSLWSGKGRNSIQTNLTPKSCLLMVQWSPLVQFYSLLRVWGPQVAHPHCIWLYLGTLQVSRWVSRWESSLDFRDLKLFSSDHGSRPLLLLSRFSRVQLCVMP